MDNEKAAPNPVMEEAVERLDEGRRQLLKLTLAGTTVFTVPLMASFSMNSLLTSPALATVGNMPDNGNQTFVCNQDPRGPAPTAELVGGNVEISWVVACFPDPTFEARADVTAVYACRNRSGVFPSGHVQTVTDTASTSVTYVLDDEDLEVIVQLTLQPPPPQQACPPGLETVLVEIHYENIVLEGLVQPEIPDVVPSSLSAVFYEI